MKVKLTDSDRIELLKMWKSGVLDTEQISGLRDIVRDDKTTPLNIKEGRAVLYELWKDLGYSEEEIEEDKKKMLREGEEPYYLMKYIEARRKRKEKPSGYMDNELMRRIRDAEIELVELGEELKRM